MKHANRLLLIALGLLTILVLSDVFALRFASPAKVSTVTTPTLPLAERAIRYQVHLLPHGLVQTLTIPAQGQFLVIPAVADKLETLEESAQKYGAIAALNGGFFDPQNHRSTSYITLQSRQVADPRQNDRLIHNPDLAPYLEKILNRTEFRQYRCGQTVRYGIALHREPVPAGCQLVSALGGGPRLLPEMTLEAEGFLAVRNGEVVRDALGSRQPNARTAIGLTHDGDVIWAMVQQQDSDSGLSLAALAEFMAAIGAEQAMNLDGGSSSTLYYKGNIFYGKLDSRGNQVRRSLKSALLVQARRAAT